MVSVTVVTLHIENVSAVLPSVFHLLPYTVVIDWLNKGELACPVTKSSETYLCFQQPHVIKFVPSGIFKTLSERKTKQCAKSAYYLPKDGRKILIHHR